MITKSLKIVFRLVHGEWITKDYNPDVNSIILEHLLREFKCFKFRSIRVTDIGYVYELHLDKHHNLVYREYVPNNAPSVSLDDLDL